jgi:hypothetical protein
MKTEAKRFVAEHYHLHPPETLDQTIRPTAARDNRDFTRDRVQYLLDGYKFLNGEFNGVSSTRLL